MYYSHIMEYYAAIKSHDELKIFNELKFSDVK